MLMSSQSCQEFQHRRATKHMSEGEDLYIKLMREAIAL